MKIRTTALLLSLASLVGCASSETALSVSSENSGAHYRAKFDRAYFTQTRDGQLDLILLADGVGDRATIDRPLTTTEDKRVRQIVHIRVLWRPNRGLTHDNPSANNAMITWHVVASPDDRLTYTGNCLARAKVGAEEATIDLDRATVSIAQMVGKVSDPLKRASIVGEIVAKRSDAAVRSYLEELASLGDRNDTALSGPPTRSAPMP